MVVSKEIQVYQRYKPYNFAVSRLAQRDDAYSHPPPLSRSGS